MKELILSILDIVMTPKETRYLYPLETVPFDGNLIEIVEISKIIKIIWDIFLFNRHEKILKSRGNSHV